MLILHRKKNESIIIGDNIKITIVECAVGGVRLAIDAPKEIAVMREELAEAERMNKASLATESNSVLSLQTAIKKGFMNNH